MASHFEDIRKREIEEWWNNYIWAEKSRRSGFVHKSAGFTQVYLLSKAIEHPICTVSVAGKTTTNFKFADGIFTFGPPQLSGISCFTPYYLLKLIKQVTRYIPL